MPKTSTTLMSGLVGLVLCGGAGAATVDLNAATNTDLNPVVLGGFDPSDVLDLSLFAGTYTAWNAWGATSCDSGGCSQGWLNQFRVRLDDNSVLPLFGGGIYPTAADALAAFVPGTLTGSSAYAFYIGDSAYDDNIGGLSINVTVQPVGAVPLPAALPLFGSALVGLGILGRRRKQPAV